MAEQCASPSMVISTAFSKKKNKEDPNLVMMPVPGLQIHPCFKD